VTGDVFDVLGSEPFDADVVLCLGFLYHTLRYNELMRKIRDLSPRYLIIDTRVIVNKKPLVRLECDPADQEGSAVADRFSYDGKTVVGVPSVAALDALLDAYDFGIERYSDWGSLVRDNPSFSHFLNPYSQGRRVTARCVSKF
jgi:hypothetical protein